MNDLLNTCLQTTADSRVIAYYSHLIPIIVGMFLASLVYFKAKKTFLSKLFIGFILSFSLWLVGDLFIWTSNNYYLVYSLWAPLDFIEIVAYSIGLYFVAVLNKQSDILPRYKALIFLMVVIPFVITVTGNSVTGFYHSVCEASNNSFLSSHKLYAEIVLLLSMVSIFIYSIFFSKNSNKKAVSVVSGSIFVFLLVFGVTEYLASTTGYYELNLYSLFLLPVFLLVIIYSIFDLNIFRFKILGTHFLVVGFFILMASQLFFVESSTDKLLTVFTFVLSLGFGILLFRNLKKESDQRVRIEKLSIELSHANERLQGLDKLKTEFLSLAAHQLRSPLTAIKGYASMLIEGSYGEIADKPKEAINRVFQSSLNLAKVVEDLLNVSKIEQGGMKYELSMVNIEKLVKELVDEQSVNAKNRGLEMTFKTDGKEAYLSQVDPLKLRQVFLNFVDNSIKYTKQGFIKVELKKDEVNKKIIFSVSDSGMGMTPEIMATLFQKFSRGDGEKMNTGGSGLGLYLAKEIIEAHKGRVWIESPGPGKGSTFYVELNSL